MHEHTSHILSLRNSRINVFKLPALFVFHFCNLAHRIAICCSQILKNVVCAETVMYTCENCIDRVFDALMTILDNTYAIPLPECFIKAVKEPTPRVVVLRIPNTKCQYENRIIYILCTCSEQASIVSPGQESCINYYDWFAISSSPY